MTDVSSIISEAAQRYGADPAAALRTANIESRGDPMAANPSGATGLFQFMPKTWAQYGRGGDPTDPTANTDAYFRLARDNAAHFQRQFGRAPTPGESYLMHQQGAGGASALLQSPDAPAESIVGSKAVLQNGGRPGMTARDFANLWTNKFATNGDSVQGNVQNGSVPNQAIPDSGPIVPTSQSPLADTFSTLAAKFNPKPAPKRQGAIRMVGATG